MDGTFAKREIEARNPGTSLPEQVMCLLALIVTAFLRIGCCCVERSSGQEGAEGAPLPGTPQQLESP